MGWTFEPDDGYEDPQPPDRADFLREPPELDERGYACAECLKPIVGTPYLRIAGGIMSYDGESHLRMSTENLCRPCWRIECLGAGIQW